MISYSLLCKSCKGREPNSMSMIEDSYDYQNYNRNELISKCYEQGIISERKCSKCGSIGNYDIWSIYCGEQPKQIHIQLQETYRGKEVDIWDEQYRHLNDNLEQLPSTGQSPQLLKRAVLKLNNEIGESILSPSISGNVFYAIYEEPINIKNSELGDIIFLNNTFDEITLKQLFGFINTRFVGELPF